MIRAASIACVCWLAGCAGSAPGPAWPKPSPSEIDGGESLAPRRVIVASEPEDAEPDDDAEAETITLETDPADTKSDDKPAEPTTDVTLDIVSDDDVIITEDLVIEIEDDD